MSGGMGTRWSSGAPQAVRIGHLHSHFHTPEPLAPAHLQAWHDAFAQGESIDVQALAGQLVGPDGWLLIRRLDLAVNWRHDSGSHEVARHWLQALQGAVAQAASEPAHAGVVRYRSRRHGLSDLMYRSALGETARQWAWQRMGLIPRAGLPARTVLDAGLRHLLDDPGTVWPTVCQWVAAEPQTAALSAMLRALPEAGWGQLLAAAGASRGYARVLARQGQRGLHMNAGVSSGEQGPAFDAAGLAAGPRAPAVRPADASAAAAGLEDWLLRRPHLAVRHGGTLAVLMAAMAWPDQGSGEAVLSQRLAAAWQCIRAAAATMAVPRSHEAERGRAALGAQAPVAAAEPWPLARPTEARERRVDEERPSASSDDDLPAAPALPDQHEWLPTAWAGTLFWLRHAGAAGFVVRQAHGPDAEPGAGADADVRGHALLALARALGVPDGDAALRAVVGGHWPHGRPHPDMAAQATALVGEWADWLAAHAPDLPEPRLQAVCQRPGRLRFEPGWIELHLALDQADTRIRRLGLDVDPGYLPWLGCVVRIRYDD